MELSQQKSHCNIWYLLQRQILLQKPITTEFIATAKTYYHGVYCKGLQRLTFIAIKVYYNKMKVIATKNFVAINLFSCSGCLFGTLYIFLLLELGTCNFEIWKLSFVHVFVT